MFRPANPEFVRGRGLADKVRLDPGRLAENVRRWVAALLSGAEGWGGQTFAVTVTGLGPKTIRAGGGELELVLEGCPAEWVRRLEAGPPPVERKNQRSSST